MNAAGTTLANGRWPTTSPAAAADALQSFIAEHTPAGARLAGIGLASFGPLVVDRDASDAGRMLATPKSGWTGSNLRAVLALRLGVPVVVETDVNAAALGEQALGAGRGLRSVAYVTVGTGIGAGLVVDGRMLHGALHPEVGHLRMQRHRLDLLPSLCPFHDDCVEGLASGPAINRRLGSQAALAHSPDSLELVGAYLGQLAATLTLAWSPQRIVWGGGAMTTPGLLDLIHAAMRDSLAGYGAAIVSAADYCVPAVLEDAGLEGAVLIARDAFG